MTAKNIYGMLQTKKCTLDYVVYVRIRVLPDSSWRLEYGDHPTKVVDGPDKWSCEQQLVTERCNVLKIAERLVNSLKEKTDARPT